MHSFKFKLKFNFKVWRVRNEKSLIVAEYFKTDGQKNIFFLQVNNKPTCLICNKTVLEFKECNIKRHYVTNHPPKYDKFKDQFRRDKITELKKVLVRQQSVFTSLSFYHESVVAANYA